MALVVSELKQGPPSDQRGWFKYQRVKLTFTSVTTGSFSMRGVRNTKFAGVEEIVSGVGTGYILPHATIDNSFTATGFTDGDVVMVGCIGR